MQALTAGAGNDTITAAPGVHPTTGAATTTLNAGDVIDGGAGTDTLNITMTATNNNSLAGVTVKNVEVINLTGANFQASGATSAALAEAQAARTAAATDLAAAQAAVVTATLQDNAAEAVEALAGIFGAGAGEAAVVSAANVNVATAAAQAAAAAAVAGLSSAAIAGLVTTPATQAALTTAGITAYTAAQYNAAAAAATKSATGATLTDGDITTRAGDLANAASAVDLFVNSTTVDLATAIRQQAAADAVNAVANNAGTPSGGTAEVITFNAPALSSGQTLRVTDGTTIVTVTAPVGGWTADQTAAAVVTAFAGTGVAGIVTTYEGAAVGSAVTLTGAAVGNQTNVTASTLQAPAPLPIGVVETTAGVAAVAAATEVAAVTVGGLVAGESVTLTSAPNITRTVTATAIDEVATLTFTPVEINNQTNNPVTQTITLEGSTLTLTFANNATTTFTGENIASALTGGLVAGAALDQPLTIDAGYNVSANGAVISFSSVALGVNATDYTATVLGDAYVNQPTLSITQGNVGNLTAAQVAAALANGVTNGPAVVTSNGAFGYSNGVVNNSTVTFTAGTAGDRADMTGTSTGATQPTVNVTLQGVTAVAAVNEVQTITFEPLLQGQSVEVDGRTVTATTGTLTASDVSDAFEAGINGGTVTFANGASVSGSLPADWTIAASPGTADTVFTSATAGPREAIAQTGDGLAALAVDPTVNITDGTAAVAADAAVIGDISGIASLSSAQFTALGFTTFSWDQYKAAAAAALKNFDGTEITTIGAAAARATALATRASELVTVEATLGDFTLAQLNAAATAALSSATGATLITNLDDSTAILARATVLDTAADAVVAAARTAVTAAIAADNTGATTLAAATAAAAAAGTASVSGATFAGSEQIWLVGADSNKTNVTVTTQAAGLRSVTGLDNKITFGTAGALAVEASTGKVDIAGAAGGLTIAGTTGTLELTNVGGTTAATGVKTLTVDMSGTSSFNVAALGQLTNVTSNGAGAVTVAGAGVKVASITTGAGADKVRVITDTLADDLATTSVDETINAIVKTGAGADVVRVATTGPGKTTVETGAGGDAIHVATVGSGISKIDAGADNDTVFLTAALGTYPNLTIDAGAGTDTLVMAGGAALTTVDYLRMNTTLSNFEAVRFTSATAGVDASKLSIGTISGFTFNAGANTITEVGAGQTLTLARAAKISKIDGVIDEIAEITGATGLTATAAGYKVGDGAVGTVYGGSLNVAVSGQSAVALALKGSAATVGVTATGGSTTVTGVAPTVTLGGATVSDLQSLTVNLTSARDTTTSTTVATTVRLATFDTGVIADTSATNHAQNLESLSSIKVNGSGVALIDNSGSSADLVSLSTIDVSGMTAFFATTNGIQSGNNLSASTITLNANAAETVILGGAKDTVNVTTSTVANMDTITGFQLNSLVTNPLAIDGARSDVLKVGLIGTSFEKFTTTATTLISALTEAGGYKVSNVDKNALVFHFGGDTYAYRDVGTAGLDDNDILVKLVGTYDLDLLVQAGPMIV